MPKNYDLRREVEVAKMQTLIDSVDAIDTSGLATEAKQDVQIINQGTETVSPPFGTKIIGWLQSIWNEISGQTNTLENNEENTFNINEKIIVDTDDDSIAVNQVLPTNINLLYGWEEQEGGVWQRIHTDTEGRLKVQQDFQPLPIGAATENTLLGVKSQTDKLSFIGTKLEVDAAVSMPTDLAKEGKQDTQILNQGTDGATPPVIAGTGIRGWLRGIYERVSNITNLTFTGGDLNVNATIGQAPTLFLKDAVDTEVNLDTVDPLNNEPLPVCLYDENGKKGTGANPFGISVYDTQTGSRQIVDQNGAAKVGEAIILSGDVLYGQPLSDLLWVELSINGGSTYGGEGEQILETGTLANGEICLQSRKRSRFMISQFNISHFGIQLTPADLLLPDTIIEWGFVDFLDDTLPVPIPNLTPNGAFIRVVTGATPLWSIVNVKNGVENETFQVDWTGVNADKFNPLASLAVYEMQYNAGTGIFFQGANFIHRLITGGNTYSANYHNPVALRIRNINGNANNRLFRSRAAGTYRLGEERGEVIPRAFTTVGVAFTRLMKAGAGYVAAPSLSRTGSSGGSGSLEIFDGLDATGILMGRIDVGGDDVKGVTLNGTFSKGLFIRITGSGTNTANIPFE